MGRKVTREKEMRKRRFAAALALAGLTREEWAAQIGISSKHLYYVLRGERDSATLDAKVDAFIEEHLTVAA
jgi:DNA-binding XRE family transcriptional regulator